MDPFVRTHILEHTGAADIGRVQVIQPLWNHYGTLMRVYLVGAQCASVVVKHIKIPNEDRHPRGFAGARSRARKVRSYAVEAHWYKVQNALLANSARTPRCLASIEHDGELFLLLEDLADSGYTRTPGHIQWAEVCVVIEWLGRFHGRMMGVDASGLWPQGTYWHLDTRPDELDEIRGTRLHDFAGLLDARLRSSAFQTLVHGDAKLANFCFTEDLKEVAAVDFQYVGRGCGMVDLAYFIGSCMGEADAKRREAEILQVYFEALESALPEAVDKTALIADWTALYPVAWADFERFMRGWSPGHRKLTTYSDKVAELTCTHIEQELMALAAEACQQAGALISQYAGERIKTRSKGFSTPAGDVVTEVDLKAQQLISDILAPSLLKYDLGWLAEEEDCDKSRLNKHAFWAVDPLDGTQYFVEGKPGYAVSIALISKSGEPLMGTIYHPITQTLYQSARGRGVSKNGVAQKPIYKSSTADEKKTWFADRSLKKHPRYEAYLEHYDIRFTGGAVTNALNVLLNPGSFYYKHTKPERGGCAIWDLAAVALMCEELGGSVCAADGNPLSLNRPDHIFFNDVGFLFTSPGLVPDHQLAELEHLS